VVGWGAGAAARGPRAARRAARRAPSPALASPASPTPAPPRPPPPRYPAYFEPNGWRFPGVGEFQCHDRRALASLAAAATAAGRPEWG
jgi:hypothetical protein